MFESETYDLFCKINAQTFTSTEGESRRKMKWLLEWNFMFLAVDWKILGSGKDFPNWFGLDGLYALKRKGVGESVIYEKTLLSPG